MAEGNPLRWRRWKKGNPWELLRFALSPCDREDMEGGSRKKMVQRMSQGTTSYKQRFQELTKDQQDVLPEVLENLGKTHFLIDFISFLDDHVTRLETRVLPKEIAHIPDTEKEMEVEYLKQLQSELHSHLKTVKAVARNPERIEEYFGTIIRLKSDLEKAKPILKQLGYKLSHRVEYKNIYSLIGESPSPPVKMTREARKQQSHPSPVEEQAKMEGESFTSGEQQVPRIQDSELKSGATVEDPFPSFLLDLPFASADDDDDNKEDIINRGKSAEQIANYEEMAREAKVFALHRSRWKDLWEPTYGYFQDKTAVSPMHFTHLTPGCRLGSAACFGQTLQIFTIKLAELKGGIKWPLFVYGLVAARDDVDHNRNLLFYCRRTESQKLDQDDPFLRLIGPSRAILFTDHVKFEVQLRVKGAIVSQDRALISAFCDYTNGHCLGVSTHSFENCFCTTELCLQTIQQTVQATVLSVRVKNGPWPFEYGGEVACSAPSFNTAPSSMNVVLLASRGRPMPNGSDGYLQLSRNVVSVESKGSLTFFIRAYSESGEIAAQGQICFMANKCNITQQTCFFRDPEVELEITVAWSTLVSDKRRIASQGWMF